MNLDERRGTATRERPGSGPAEGGGDYPASIEGMSEKWRSLQQGAPQPAGQSFVKQHFLLVGLGLGLLLISLITVIGGFIFLVWNAH